MGVAGGIVEALRRSASWEGAALVVARAIFSVLSQEPALTPKRVLLFRRPADRGGSVDAVAHVPFPVPSTPALPAGAKLAPSLSLWASVTRERGCVLVRRDPAAFLPLVPGETPPGAPGPSAVEGVLGTTHVLALPLLTAAVEGLVAVEARVAEGDTLPAWRAVAADLVDLIAEATPFLMRVMPAEAGRVGLLNLPIPAAPALAQSLRLLERVADLDEPILLTGPTGVGKSQLARACHESSKRAGKPFVSANLIALPEELRASHLFGWRRGAATGLETDYRGFVAEAEGGTLFLDEVDKLGLGEQRALLEFLEERTYRRIGDAGKQRADVRIIAATNAELHTLMARGVFLEDLYARICTFSFRIPPLEERRAEIVPWAEHFLRRADSRYGGTTTLSREAGGALEAGAWPRNLRELEQTVLRARLLARLDLGTEEEARILMRHVYEARAWGGRAEAEGGPDRVAVEAALRQVAKALLAAERARPNAEFWNLVDGALRAMVTLEGLQASPEERVGPIQTIIDQRNAARRRQGAEDLLDALWRWLGGDQSSA